MPIIETAVAKCDVCGAEEQCIEADVNGVRKASRHWKWVVDSRPFAVHTLICPKHSIQVTHNGDVVTLMKGEA